MLQYKCVVCGHGVSHSSEVSEVATHEVRTSVGKLNILKR
jgi:hypothetical protein